MFFIRYALVIILASVVWMVSHIYLPSLTEPLISKYMSSIHTAHPPYSNFITTIAYITSIIPTIGLVILYYFVEQHLPYRRFYKGIIFSVILLFVNGEFLRMPIMNLLIGNPLKVVILQDGQKILVTLLTGLVIAFTMPSWKKSKKN